MKGVKVMTRYLIPVSLAASVLLISSVGISQAQPLPTQQTIESKVAQTTQQGNQSVPAIIDEGFEAYRTQGVIAASEVWFQNSLDYLRNQGAVAANQLAGDLQGSGAYLGYSILYSTSVTENTQILYIESQYEHGTGSGSLSFPHTTVNQQLQTFSSTQILLMCCLIS
jgi:hypothetical protein